MSRILVCFSGFDLYLVNFRIYPVLVDQRHGDWTDLNVILICAKTAFQMTCLQSKVAKISWGVNRGWAQSTMATKSIAIPGSKNRGIDP
jgi:hypothetical protein